MTTKHTPGPWKVYVGWDRQFMDRLYILDLSGPSKVIAIVCGNGCTILENQANAYLIATAPKLLAALKTITEAYQQHFDVMPVVWQTYDNIACEAISEAEKQA